MGLSELLQKIGDENYQTQILSQNLIGSKIKDGQGELTFVSSVENVPNILGDCQNVGIVVWLDKDVLKKAQEQTIPDFSGTITAKPDLSDITQEPSHD